MNNTDRQTDRQTDNNKTKKNYSQKKFLGSLTGHGPSFAGAVFDVNYLAPTLTTCQGGGRMPHILVKDSDE